MEKKAIIIVGDSASVSELIELCQEISADTVDRRFHIKMDQMEELKAFQLPKRDKEYWKSKFERKKRTA